VSDQKNPPQSGNNVPAQGSLFAELPEQEHGDARRERPVKRKLQVANGYLLEFDNISRVLSASWENRSLNRINRVVLVESTGFPDRQVESLMSVASAMGLVQPRVQKPTVFGSLVATHDVFFERQGTLEWCHYRGAGSMRNLVWFDVFNRLLVEYEPMTHPEWNTWFRKELAGQYSERTIQKVVREEVHFVIDAYLQQKLKVLGILELGDGDAIVPQRHRQIDHLVFAAMLYDFIESHGGRTFEITELTRLPGSPAVAFVLDADSMRTLVEALHMEGLVRYETTHNLDQIRLIPGYGSDEFLRAYFEGRRPCREDETGGAHA
jgi:hypothetical protein